MIDVRHLTKRYGEVVAVADVSFTVQPGESVALWGPNGAGKTTVVRSILGLASYEGFIEVAGLDGRNDGKQARALIGHVPQELAFYDELTVFETIDFSARLKRVTPQATKAALARVGLTSHLTKAVGSLSGGMKQRLAIGLALLGDPPILLLDEPTSNLDAGSREGVVRLLHELRSPSRSMLLTSHHIDEIGLLADRVISFDAGRIVLDCGPQELSDKLGLHSWLHVKVATSAPAAAAAVLVASGFPARLNGSGILVEVSAQGKGAALRRLEESGYRVVDFEVWR